jgi:hypothetical protein
VRGLVKAVERKVGWGVVDEGWRKEIGRRILMNCSNYIIA